MLQDQNNQITTTLTAHRKVAVRRRHRDVASANTPSDLHTVLSLVTFFARAKKVTRSPQASESFGLLRTRRSKARSWIPAFAGMTSVQSRLSPAFAGMTSARVGFQLALE